jgi:hypothetical protein
MYIEAYNYSAICMPRHSAIFRMYALAYDFSSICMPRHSYISPNVCRGIQLLIDTYVAAHDYLSVCMPRHSAISPNVFFGIQLFIDTYIAAHDYLYVCMSRHTIICTYVCRGTRLFVRMYAAAYNPPWYYVATAVDMLCMLATSPSSLAAKLLSSGIHKTSMQQLFFIYKLFDDSWSLFECSSVYSFVLDPFFSSTRTWVVNVGPSFSSSSLLGSWKLLLVHWNDE